MNENKRRYLAHECYRKTGLHPAIEHTKREMTQLRIRLIKYLLKEEYVGDREVGLSKLTHDLRISREKVRQALYGAVISPSCLGVVEMGTTDRGMFDREASVKIANKKMAQWYMSFLGKIV